MVKTGISAGIAQTKDKLKTGEFACNLSGTDDQVSFQKGLLEDHSEPHEFRSWECANVTVTKILPRVKGRLREHVSYWESVGANPTILDILREGYKIPFYSIPPQSFSPNNSSAFKHSEFVCSSIRELLETGRVKEVFNPPYVVNPLSVSENAGKLRLILDLRLVNKHVFKDKIKFDDWKTMESFLDYGGFGFKFDITQGYHHIDIHPLFQCYLGFSWVENGVRRFYIFLVLPFGLTSAPFVFTKVVRVLIKFWRNQAIKICCFIDDGFGCAQGFLEAEVQSKIVRNSLIKAGWVINDEKSQWEPIQKIVWIGVGVDFSKGILHISEKRVQSIQESLKTVINNLPDISARKLARLAGKIISTKLVLGNITQLKTRYIYHCIATARTWDNDFSLLHDRNVTQEISFWNMNFARLNYRCWHLQVPPDLIISSDASQTGLAALISVGDTEFISYKKFSPEESNTSSTYRVVCYFFRSFFI